VKSIRRKLLETHRSKGAGLRRWAEPRTGRLGVQPFMHALAYVAYWCAGKKKAETLVGRQKLARKNAV